MKQDAGMMVDMETEIMAAMIWSGAKYYEKTGMQPVEGMKKDDKGHYKTLTKEDLEVFADADSIEKWGMLIQKLMNDKKNINTQNKSKKKKKR